MLIYGFGSYFSSANSYRDIDFLIIHESTSADSCLKAIYLKKIILNKIDGASVTILSKSSEKEFDFINTAKASLLEEINDCEIESCIDDLVKRTKLLRRT